MPRRYRKRRYAIARPLKTAKYSNETYSTTYAGIVNPLGHSQEAVSMIPDTTVLATRKVKNFTLRIGLPELHLLTTPTPTNTNANFCVLWALVFVPQNTEPQALQFSDPTAADPVSISIYEPNQNVIMSGMFTDFQTYTYKTRLARNLNSGDTVALVTNFFNYGATGTPQMSYSIAAVLNYAISY